MKRRRGFKRHGFKRSYKTGRRIKRYGSSRGGIRL